MALRSARPLAAMILSDGLSGTGKIFGNVGSTTPATGSSLSKTRYCTSASNLSDFRNYEFKLFKVAHNLNAQKTKQEFVRVQQEVTAVMQHKRASALAQRETVKAVFLCQVKGSVLKVVEVDLSQEDLDAVQRALKAGQEACGGVQEMPTSLNWVYEGSNDKCSAGSSGVNSGSDGGNSGSAPGSSGSAPGSSGGGFGGGCFGGGGSSSGGGGFGGGGFGGSSSGGGGFGGGSGGGGSGSGGGGSGSGGGTSGGGGSGGGGSAGSTSGGGTSDGGGAGRSFRDRFWEWVKQLDWGTHVSLVAIVVLDFGYTINLNFLKNLAHAWKSHYFKDNIDIINKALKMTYPDPNEEEVLKMELVFVIDGVTVRIAESQIKKSDVELFKASQVAALQPKPAKDDPVSSP